MHPIPHTFPLYGQSLIEQIPAVTYVCHMIQGTRTTQYISPQVESILGISPDSLEGEEDHYLRHVHPDDRELVVKERTFSALNLAPFVVRYRLIDRSGKFRWIQDSATVSTEAESGAIVFRGVFLEITEAKNLEDELSRWDEEARTLLTNLPVMVARYDRRFRCLYLNRWVDGDVDLPPERYLGKTARELGLAEEPASLIEAALVGTFEMERSQLIEYSVSTFQECRFFESLFVPERDRQGQVVTALAVTTDLTERRKAQAALKASEQRFRQLAESTLDVFWLLDLGSRKFLYVSPAFERIWGGTSERLRENPWVWLESIHEDDRELVRESLQERFDKGSCDIEYRMVRPDGNIRWIHDRVFPMSGIEGESRGVAGIAEDITERKRLDEERLRSSKLESLGLLAGGLAHDFNNLLTAILGQLSLAKFSLPPDNPVYPRLHEAELASLRAQDLTQQLLTFAKGGTPVKKTASLKEVLEENVRFVLAGSNIQYQFHLSDDLWPVEIDVGQISQVVQNLVINAKQAMPNGGTITIAAKNLTIEHKTGRTTDTTGLPEGTWVRVAFTDQGIGIPREHLAKIFDPYFTTKPTGNGLGLATCYSITKNHGGILTVDSEVGRGTTFFMMLPASPSSEPSLPKSTQEVVQGKGKILVMDDELPIRSLLCEMLELCGYVCQMAKNGEEAVALFCREEQSHDPFQAVILDLTIPGGMGGKDVLAELLKINPQVRAIVVSGYSNDPVLSKFSDYGFKARISKPFRLAELSATVSQVIVGEAS